MTDKSNGYFRCGSLVMLGSGLVVTLLLGACDGVTQTPSEGPPELAITTDSMDQTVSSSPVFLAKSFSREEITAVARLMIKDEAQTQEFVELLMEGKHGALLDSEDEFLTILALMSDDLTVRVGALRGLTPHQARTWAGAILEVDGHPSTWTFERDEENEEETPSE